MFGWWAKDNAGTAWKDSDIAVSKGMPTSWSQFVDFLENNDRYLLGFGLMWGKEVFLLPPLADCYAFHYNLEVELTNSGQMSRKYAVGTSVKGELATIRDLDEDGKTHLHPSYSDKVILMKPSPLAYKE